MQLCEELILPLIAMWKDYKLVALGLSRSSFESIREALSVLTNADLRQVDSSGQLPPADKSILFYGPSDKIGKDITRAYNGIAVVESDEAGLKEMEHGACDYVNYKGRSAELMRSLHSAKNAKEVHHLEALKYKTLIDSTSDGIWHHDPETDHVHWSDSLYHILGYEYGTKINLETIPDLAHPDERETIKSGILERVIKGKPYSAEFRIKKDDGEYIWIKAQGSAVIDGDGKVVLYLGIVKNIDQRKRAELDLEERNRQLENIANGISGVLARHRESPAGEIENVYIGGGVEKLWDLKPEEVMADPSSIWTQLKKSEIDKLGAAFYNAVEKNEVLDHTYSREKKNGEIQWLHVVALPKKLEDGTIEWDSITMDVTALKNAERAAKEQQELLNGIFENINGVIQRYVVYPDGTDRTIFLSSGFERITGIPVNEALENQEELWSQVYPEDREELTKSIEESVKSLHPWQQKWRIVSRSGETKWVHGSGTPKREEDGSVVFDGVITDITELQRYSEKLESAQERFRLAAGAAQMGLWEFDVEKNHLVWDEQMFKIFGVGPEDFTSSVEDWENRLHPEDAEKAKKGLADSIEHKLDLEFQFRIIRKNDGEIRHIRASAKSIFDDQGNVIKMFGVNWDVTFMVRSQEKLTESNRRYELASKATRDAIWDWDLKTHTMKWNKAFLDVFGHEIDDETKNFENWQNLVHKEDFDRVVNGLKCFIESKNSQWEESYRFKKGDGTYAYVEDRGFIVRDYNGEAIRMVGSMHDVTQVTAYLKALESQNEKLKSIAWTQSHELRGPLTRIMGLVDLIDQEGFTEIDQSSFLNHINTSAIELDGVIKRIVKTSEKVDFYDPNEASNGSS